MDAKKLGQFIAEMRKEKEMTQAELASKLHVTDLCIGEMLLQLLISQLAPLHLGRSLQ